MGTRRAVDSGAGVMVPGRLRRALCLRPPLLVPALQRPRGEITTP